MPIKQYFSFLNSRHILLDVNKDFSHNITHHIDKGDLSLKPGWIRLSIHPTMTNSEVHYIMNAIKEVAKNYKEWEIDYTYNNSKNEFLYKDKEFREINKKRAKEWFAM